MTQPRDSHPDSNQQDPKGILEWAGHPQDKSIPGKSGSRSIPFHPMDFWLSQLLGPSGLVTRAACKTASCHSTGDVTIPRRPWGRQRREELGHGHHRESGRSDHGETLGFMSGPM